jgi:hypothetical protein
MAIFQSHNGKSSLRSGANSLRLQRPAGVGGGGLIGNVLYNNIVECGYDVFLVDTFDSEPYSITTGYFGVEPMGTDAALEPVAAELEAGTIFGRWYSEKVDSVRSNGRTMPLDVGVVTDKWLHVEMSVTKAGDLYPQAQITVDGIEGTDTGILALPNFHGTGTRFHILLGSDTKAAAFDLFFDNVRFR